MTYQGKGPKSNDNYNAVFGSSSAPFVTLLNEMPEEKRNQRYSLFCDNLSTSFHLLTHFKQMEYDVTGTIRENHIPKNCPIISKKAMKKKNRGEVASVLDKQNGIILVRWGCVLEQVENIPPDQGIKDKPPEKKADESQGIQAPTQVIPAQENKSELDETNRKFHLESNTGKEPESDNLELKKGDVSPDTPEAYVDCISDTPRKPKISITHNVWTSSNNPQQFDYADNTQMLISNTEDDNVHISLGEAVYSSEVRATGNFGSNALAQIINIDDLSEMRTVSSSPQTPSNASLTDEGNSDNELDSSLKTTIRQRQILC
ncbi:hypothetical protein JTB14_029048 [Gonioctena quinquepunctata]|nr:hypothetical protein JTB14_029048 [Gonioctena quinquepunctata]